VVLQVFSFRRTSRQTHFIYIPYQIEKTCSKEKADKMKNFVVERDVILCSRVESVRRRNEQRRERGKRSVTCRNDFEVVQIL